MDEQNESLHLYNVLAPDIRPRMVAPPGADHVVTKRGKADGILLAMASDQAYAKTFDAW